MTKENEKKTFTKEEELNQVFEKGRKIGRVEGMLNYQNHLLKNLGNDNQELKKKLKFLNEELNS